MVFKVSNQINKRYTSNEINFLVLVNKTLIEKLVLLPTVRGWTPAHIWVRDQHSPDHEILILVHQIPVLENALDVVRVVLLRTFRTGNVNPTLRDFYFKVGLQTGATGTMVTSHDFWEILHRSVNQTQGTFPHPIGGFIQGMLGLRDSLNRFTHQVN